MKNKMVRKFIWIVLLPVAMVTCKDKSAPEGFEVKGKINNNPGRVIYLEEIPVATMQRIIVDSAELGADGKFELQSEPREASVYSLRLDRNAYPMAQVINDAKKVEIDISFNKENNQFPESYSIKGSEASTQLKDFTTNFNAKLLVIQQSMDSMDRMKRLVAADSVIESYRQAKEKAAKEARALLDNTLSASKNAALSMAVLGYYQSTANTPGLLDPVSNDDVFKLISDIATKFPDHSGVASVKKAFDDEAAKATGWVGQTAPDINLPDVNGRPVTLSSFRGKYVLVDFWASWCKPCRFENPHVVAAYNKFKGKNFTILGVSLDKPGEREQWMKAIKDDNLTWTQVSDLQFWNSPVVPLYRIDGIPFNVLVDPQGKVIAQGLRGEQLEAKLAEVLP
jgi:thiol-disulfide isomerase/thioredoxin